MSRRNTSIGASLEPGVAGGLYVREETRAGATILTLHGSLDRWTVPILRNRIAPLIQSGNRNVIVKLSGAEITDLEGLEFLTALLTAARRDGGDIALAAVRPATLKLLRTVEADAAFAIHPTVDKALKPAALPAAAAQ